MSETPMLMNHNCKKADNKEAGQAGLERLEKLLSDLLDSHCDSEALQRHTNEALQFLQSSHRAFLLGQIEPDSFSSASI